MTEINRAETYEHLRTILKAFNEHEAQGGDVRAACLAMITAGCDRLAMHGSPEAVIALLEGQIETMRQWTPPVRGVLN